MSTKGELDRMQGWVLNLFVNTTNHFGKLNPSWAYFSFRVLEIKPRALGILRICFSTELYPSPEQCFKCVQRHRIIKETNYLSIFITIYILLY